MEFFYILARKAIGDIGDLRKLTRMRVTHGFEYAVHVFNMCAVFITQNAPNQTPRSGYFP